MTNQTVVTNVSRSQSLPSCPAKSPYPGWLMRQSGRTASEKAESVQPPGGGDQQEDAKSEDGQNGIVPGVRHVRFGSARPRYAVP